MPKHVKSTPRRRAPAAPSCPRRESDVYVTLQISTLSPRCRCLYRVPPARISASSGCAKIATTRVMEVHPHRLAWRTSPSWCSAEEAHNSRPVIAACLASRLCLRLTRVQEGVQLLHCGIGRPRTTHDVG